ncbi:MAG: c-type cytochrome [Donghicola eburneus]|nr:c-type cytochrome [Donghicola eburneus]MCI5041783.1 c-type cytochrome [Donghicola eburneus]
MKTILTAAATILALAAPALAEGDADKGAKEFRKCKACHKLEDGAKSTVGPNLYGVMDRTAGTLDGYKYSSSMVEAGEAGLVWTVETLEKYLPDPSSYLKEVTGDDGAKSKMAAQRIKSAEDIAAYLASVVE